MARTKNKCSRDGNLQIEMSAVALFACVVTKTCRPGGVYFVELRIVRDILNISKEYQSNYFPFIHYYNGSIKEYFEGHSRPEREGIE